MGEPLGDIRPGRRDMTETRERARGTIIVGAGIAGLACARSLCDARRPFLMISEDVGGRIQRSQDGAVNLGAYYVRADYAHVNRYVRFGRRINALSTVRHDVDGAYTYWDRRLLLHLPQGIRFLRLLAQFYRRYRIFTANSVGMSQARAIRADPLLWDLYREPAEQFVRRHRINEIARTYLGPAVHGTAFTSLERLTAFPLLQLALPAIVPIYEFFFRFDLLQAGFEDAVLIDTVTRITPDVVGYRVETSRSGVFAADHVVVATPTDVAKRLLALGDVKNPVRAHMFQIKGNLRSPWAGAAISLFPGDHPTLAIAQQSDSSTLFCSQSERPDFDGYFSNWEVVEHKHWAPAFHLEGDALLECEQGPGLYLIGDHNVCGLEDAYITGLYAANKIAQHPIVERRYLDASP